MKIHLITNLFHPDELAGASLFTDLAVYLHAQGHDVRVTTTFPYYPAWKLRPEDVGVRLREETFRGFPLRRVQMFVPAKPTGGSRVKSDLSFFFSLLQRARFPGWTPEVVLTASPMFSQCLVQNFLYPGKNIPKLIVVQDFVVDAALELKMLNLPGLPWFLLGLENWAFKSAQTLFTISQPMLEKLQGKLKGSRRCLLVPNWIHRSLEDEIQRQHPTPVVREKATLFYSGNLGIKQGLPFFIDSFKDCSGPWNLKVHGGGAELETLLTQVDGVDSVTLGGVLDEVDYVHSLRTATACLITQKPGVGANFLPSKLLPALATGTPILAVCEADSPLGREVIEGQFGEVINPADTPALEQTLRRWQSEPDLLAAMGAKSLARGKLYSRETILPQYESELRRLVEKNR
ncbi:MAG: glycosyltransferase family 4 protein [Chthoniobacterales bacterium]